MEQYPSKMLNEIGTYDNLSDSYYNLGALALYGPIENITLYLNIEHSAINGIEMYYKGISSGVYQGIGYKVNAKDSISLKLNDTNDSLSHIYGSFIGNSITKLIFTMKSGNEQGFNNEKDFDRSKLKHFTFPSSNQLLSFKIAFSKTMTYLSPIFSDDDPNKYIMNKSRGVIESKELGKKFNDSIEYNLSEEIINEGYLSKIELFHDGNIMMGIRSTYQMNNQLKKTVSYGNIKDTNKGCCNIIDFNIHDESLMLDITIRSGNMIDGITITQSSSSANLIENDIVISGGSGGGPHYFSTKPSMRFIGFECSGTYYLHTLRLLFK